MAIDAACASHLEGHVLPREAYFSREYYEREQVELFGQCWQFVGMLEDYGQPGAYKTVQVGPHPILVIRGGDGELRALHNVCRHRGATVVKGQGVAKKALVCPYHRWTYGTDGCLRHVPQVEEFGSGLDRAALGLRKAKVDTFKSMVFVHPDPNAQPLVDWLGSFPEYHGPFEPEQLVEVLNTSYPIQANWKTFIENHQDGYHLGYVHQANLEGYDHRRQEHFLYGRHWSFYEPVLPGHAPPDLRLTGMPIIKHIDKYWHGSSVHMLFPNLALAGGASFWSTIQVLPTGPESCRLDMRLRVEPREELRKSSRRLLRKARRLVGDTEERTRAATATTRRQLRDRHLSVQGIIESAKAPDRPLGVIEEDVYCCEAIQQGLRSPNFEIGPLAPRYERAILAFQRNVLDYVPWEGASDALGEGRDARGDRQSSSSRRSRQSR